MSIFLHNRSAAPRTVSLKIKVSKKSLHSNFDVPPDLEGESGPLLPLLLLHGAEGPPGEEGGGQLHPQAGGEGDAQHGGVPGVLHGQGDPSSPDKVTQFIDRWSTCA